jgi:hypothetical protein
MEPNEKEIKDVIKSLNQMKIIVEKYQNEFSEKEKLNEDTVTIETLNNNMSELKNILKKLNDL